MLARPVRGRLRSSATARMLVGSALVQGFLVVSGVLAARLLGPEDRGHLALLALPPLILGTVGGLGVPQALAFKWAQEQSRQAAVLRVVAPVLVAQAIALTAITAVIYALFLVPNAPETGLTAMLLTPSTAGILMWQYAVAAAQSRQKFDLAAAVLVAAPAMYVVGLLVGVATGLAGLEQVAIAWTVSYIVVGGLGLHLAIRHLKPAPPGRETVTLSEILRFGLRVVPSLASPLSALRVDQAAVGLLLGASTLGVYVAALALTNLPLILAVFMGVTVAGMVGRERDPGLAHVVMTRMVLRVLVASSVVAAVVGLFAPVLISGLFGTAFESAVSPTRILLLGAVAASLQRVIGDGLRAMGDASASSLAELSSWLFLVPALLVLPRLAGLDGAALAVTGTYGVGLSVILVAWFRQRVRHGQPAEFEGPSRAADMVKRTREQWRERLEHGPVKTED